MSTKTIYGFDDLGNKIAIGNYSDTSTVTLQAVNVQNSEITISGVTLSGAGEYSLGASCTIEASQNNGGMYIFLGWADHPLNEDISEAFSNTSLTFTVTRDITYYAHYRNRASGPIIG